MATEGRPTMAAAPAYETMVTPEEPMPAVMPTTRPALLVVPATEETPVAVIPVETGRPLAQAEEAPATEEAPEAATPAETGRRLAQAEEAPAMEVRHGAVLHLMGDKGQRACLSRARGVGHGERNQVAQNGGYSDEISSR